MKILLAKYQASPPPGAKDSGLLNNAPLTGLKAGLSRRCRVAWRFSAGGKSVRLDFASGIYSGFHSDASFLRGNKGATGGLSASAAAIHGQQAARGTPTE